MPDEQMQLLRLAERLGAKAQGKVLSALDDPKFFERNIDEWQEFGLNEKEAAALVDQASLSGIEKRLQLMQRAGIRAYCTKSSPEACDDELPPILFLRGQMANWATPGIGLVGTRKPTRYGLDIAKAVAREAASRGIHTVSGAALGIDTAAHQASLDAGGPTVAVLGCGLFHTYPPKAGPLLDRIAEQGMLVSQFTPDTEPDRKTFPIRNRVIAALSKSVVVVEGARGSGARYTAKAAQRMKRRLFAVPGEITCPQAWLPNQLLKEGAIPLCAPADPFDGEAKAPMRKSDSSRQGRLNFEHGAVKPGKLEDGILQDLSPIERDLVKQIEEGKGQIDELLSSGLAETGEINRILLDLELKGLIEQEHGRNYILRH